MMRVKNIKMMRREICRYEREEQPIRSQILEYKEYLGKSYKVSSANSMIIALNAYLRFIGRPDAETDIQRCGSGDNQG